MPSPFPGMDPYIEGWIWGDFHARLIPAVYDQLASMLPIEYDASTEIFVWRIDESEEERTLIGGPDIHVTEDTAPSAGTAVATITAPVTSILPGIVRRQKYIKIVDRSSRRVITAIEFLSPSNKTWGETGRAYRLKRDGYLGSGINLVEVDLLRGGVRPPMGDPPPPITDYYILISRSLEPSRLGIWPIGVRDPIPRLPVPLEPGTSDIMIDLRSCIDHVYDKGRYFRRLEYDQPPRPPLWEPDATWARELLASHQPAKTGE